MFVTGRIARHRRRSGAEAARHGYDVAFTYRERRDAAEQVIAGVGAASPDARCAAYQLDVRDADAVERGRRSGPGDVRHGARGGRQRRDHPRRAWRSRWPTRTGAACSTPISTGAFFVARQFLPAFLANGFGRFIFMSSIAAKGMSGDVAYSASKAGMLGLSGALAKEYGRKGITSNALLMSLFETEMTLKELSAKNREFYEAHCPAGRIGQVSEVAAAVLFLASEGASFVNGQELGVTGGLDWLH